MRFGSNDCPCGIVGSETINRFLVSSKMGNYPRRDSPISDLVKFGI